MISRMNVPVRARGIHEKNVTIGVSIICVMISITGKFFCPATVRGKHARLLRGDRLIAELEHYMDSEIPDMDLKRLIFYDALKGKPFAFTSVKDRVPIQIQLLMTLLKGSGQL